MRRPAVLTRGCMMAMIVGWSATAKAFPGYPSVVDTWLDESGAVEMFDKPTGCQLCHVSDQGGTVELQPFGNLLVSSYGLPTTSEDDAVLTGALQGLAAANPTLLDDMRQGMDPNADPALTAQVLPQPEYGCSSVARPLAKKDVWREAFALLALLACACRRGRRQTHRMESRQARQNVVCNEAPAPPGIAAAVTDSSFRPGRCR